MIAHPSTRTGHTCACPSQPTFPVAAEAATRRRTEVRRSQHLHRSWVFRHWRFRSSGFLLHVCRIPRSRLRRLPFGFRHFPSSGVRPTLRVQLDFRRHLPRAASGARRFPWSVSFHITRRRCFRISRATEVVGEVGGLPSPAGCTPFACESSASCPRTLTARPLCAFERTRARVIPPLTTEVVEWIPRAPSPPGRTGF